MKKYLSLLLVLVIAVTLLAGCGSSKKEAPEASEKTEGVSIDTIKTIGDIDNAKPEEYETSVYDDIVVYAFKLGDTYYRAKAAISKEEHDAYNAVDYADDDAQEQQSKILAPLKIDEMENLSDQMLSQEDLEALAGKTGKELVKEGWTYVGSYMLDEMSFEMNYGPFAYWVSFDGSADGKNTEDYDSEKETADMKVKSVKFSALGQATDIEQEEQ